MIKYAYIKKLPVNMSDIFTGVQPIIFIILYVFLINKIKLNNKKLLIFSALYFITSIIIGTISAKYFMPVESFENYSFLWYSVYILFIYTGFFPALQYYFFKGWINNDQKLYERYNPKDASHAIKYHDRPNIVMIVGRLYRYSFIVMVILLLILYVNFVLLSLPYSSHFVFYPVLITVIDSAVFFITMAYLRLLARCPNCHLEIYRLHNNYTDFLDAAKYAVKYKIIECYTCHAKFILDKKMNYDAAKKIIDKVFASKEQ